MREILKALADPFPPDKIKQRKGAGGMVLDYIEGHEVIRRLNECCPDWSFTIVSAERFNRTEKRFDKKQGQQVVVEVVEVVVHGKLDLGLPSDTDDGLISAVTHEEYGSSDAAESFDPEEKGMTLGDAYKSAATDSLKKCATHPGVGLHLYDKGAKKPADAKTGDDPGNASDKPPASSRGDGTALANDKQRRMLYAKASDIDNLYPNLSATLKHYASKDTETTFADVDAMVKAYDKVKASGADITRVPDGVVVASAPVIPEGDDSDLPF